MRDYELVSAQAATNSLAVAKLPKEIMESYNSTTVSSDTEARVTKLIHSCYLGDAQQAGVGVVMEFSFSILGNAMPFGPIF